VLGIACLHCLASSAAAQLPAPPVLGPGRLQLGGYAAVTFSRPEHPETVERFEVSEFVAALLVWGQIVPRVSYLVEMDVAKRTTATWTGREADQRLVPVRAYLEYARSDLLRLRAGRFLTPVGQWNEGHAEPLTWTPTRPLTTYRPFGKSLTGLLLAGEGRLGGRDAGYALFWSPAVRIRNSAEEDETSFVRALGGRVATELHPGVTVGVSVGDVRRSRPPDDDTVPDGVALSLRAEHADDDRDERHEDAQTRILAGADVRWVGSRFELTVEGAWLPAVEHAAYEGGAFAQGAFQIAGPVWGVGRAEVFRPVDGLTVRVGYAGLTVRAGPRFVAKMGRQFSRRPSERIPEGWFLSFSSLF
jgi:hypothetical protein